MKNLLVNNDNVIIEISNTSYYAKKVGSGDNTHYEQCTKAQAEAARAAFLSGDNTQDGIIMIVDKNVAYQLSSGTLYTVEDSQEEITPYAYKYIDNEIVINYEYRREQILKELSELDSIINRATEDLYIATNTTPYANIAEIIAQKEALRTELAEIPVE